MAQRLPSESSIDSMEIPVENSVTSTHDDEKEFHLSQNIPYLEIIAKFNKINRNERFDIRASWSGMNIKNMTKDQLDNSILAQRVIDLLEGAAIQAKIMKALPKLLESDGALLRKWMPPREAEFIINSFRDTVLNTENKKQTRSLVGIVIDKSLQQAYRMLSMNKCLPVYVEKHPPGLRQNMRAFLYALSEFGVYVRKHMGLTANDVAEKDARMRNIMEQMRMRRFELKRLQANVNENKADFDGKLSSKIVLINDMQEQLDATLRYFNGLMQDCLQTSDKILYHSSEASTAEQAELSELSKEAKVTYTNTLEGDLTEERMLRTRKIKLEAQLAMWLSKYDTDVGEKQHILDQMTEGYERENAEVQELECLMIEQQQIYLRYLDEQEEELYGKIKEKLFVIASKRAARIIQKYWRAYLIRKLNRKPSRLRRAKKGKDKKRK